MLTSPCLKNINTLDKTFFVKHRIPLDVRTTQGSKVILPLNTMFKNLKRRPIPELAHTGTAAPEGKGLVTVSPTGVFVPGLRIYAEG